MRSFHYLLLAATVASLAGCQTSRLAVSARPTGLFAPAAEYVPTDSDKVLLLHDSQGPQATRAVLPAEEAALFRR